jgi:hypothetical protein
MLKRASALGYVSCLAGALLLGSASHSLAMFPGFKIELQPPSWIQELLDRVTQTFPVRGSESAQKFACGKTAESDPALACLASLDCGVIFLIANEQRLLSVQLGSLEDRRYLKQNGAFIELPIRCTEDVFLTQLRFGLSALFGLHASDAERFANEMMARASRLWLGQTPTMMTKSESEVDPNSQVSLRDGLGSLRFELAIDAGKARLSSRFLWTARDFENAVRPPPDPAR